LSLKLKPPTGEIASPRLGIRKHTDLLPHMPECGVAIVMDCTAQGRLWWSPWGCRDLQQHDAGKRPPGDGPRRISASIQVLSLRFAIPAMCKFLHKLRAQHNDFIIMSMHSRERERIRIQWTSQHQHASSAERFHHQVHSNERSRCRVGADAAMPRRLTS
jgi:hypothetical protein